MTAVANVPARYRAPFWMPGGHFQTIWPAMFSRAHRGNAPVYRRERLTAPDGDFVDVDWVDMNSGNPSGPSEHPLLVLFHGLEGSSASHYALAFADIARQRGWDYVVPHFRGCSGELNHAPRAYHSGDYEEVYWLLRTLAAGRTQVPAPAHPRPAPKPARRRGKPRMRWATRAERLACSGGSRRA